MKNQSFAWLVAAAVGLAGTTQAFGQQTCKPILSFGKVEFSAMQPPTLERRWTAIVSVDASRCATPGGLFTIGFSRFKETGPEVEFRERFKWSSPSVKVDVVFSADEAVERYWLDSVEACPCAK